MEARFSGYLSTKPWPGSAVGEADVATHRQRTAVEWHVAIRRVGWVGVLTRPSQDHADPNGA